MKRLWHVPDTAKIALLVAVAAVTQVLVLGLIYVVAQCCD